MLGVLIQLFITFFKIGLFGFGGGYSMLSIIQYEIVEAHQWLTVKEFTDIVAISQSTPGPIAVNSATYVGYAVTGGTVLGSAVATLAVCLPSIIIMLIVCK
ncbi:MAG: chromate transporter, partial [Prevotellaceae bacterium]|nr:chromate transporter [Prevotellaceae bacterium]